MRAPWEFRPGPEDLRGEDNATAGAGRRVLRPGSPPFVPVRVGTCASPGPARGSGVPDDPAPGNYWPPFTCSTARLCSPIHASYWSADFGTRGS